MGKYSILVRLIFLPFFSAAFHWLSIILFRTKILACFIGFQYYFSEWKKLKIGAVIENLKRFKQKKKKTPCMKWHKYNTKLVCIGVNLLNQSITLQNIFSNFFQTEKHLTKCQVIFKAENVVLPTYRWGEIIQVDCSSGEIIQVEIIQVRISYGRDHSGRVYSGRKDLGRVCAGRKH